MASGKGYAARAAFHRAVAAPVWGEEVLLGAGDQVSYASEGGAATIQIITSDQITGDALAGAGGKGNEDYTPELSGMDLTYVGLEKMLRCVMGGYSKVGAIAPYNHKMPLGVANDLLFGTLAINKQVKLFVWDSWKPMSASFDFTPAAQPKVSIGGTARSLLLGDGDNTPATFATVTPPVLGHLPVSYRDLVVTIDPVGAPGNTIYCVGKVGVSIARTSTPELTTCGGAFSDEPVSDDVQITGSLEFPTYDSVNELLFEGARNNTGYKLRLLCTNGANKFEILLPDVRFAGFPIVSGRNAKIPLTLNFTAYTAAAAVDGVFVAQIATTNAQSDIDELDV